MATAPAPSRSPTDAVAALIAAVGAGAVATDTAARTLFGQDVFSRGALPIAVFTPADTVMLSAGLRAVVPFGIDLMPRGG
ncbi:MAG: hypothetical protein RLZZ58_1940, partial [Pseudomonadota bacterium]